MSSENATTGICAWRTVQTRRPFGSADFSIAGKTTGTGGARFGQSRAVDAHETTAGTESGAASSVRPRGTMLSVTRRAGSR